MFKLRRAGLTLAMGLGMSLHHRLVAVALFSLTFVACGGKETPTTTPSNAPTDGGSATAPITTADASASKVAPPSASSVALTAPAPKALTTKLEVKRLVLARGVEGREPLEPDTVFNAKETRVYAFVELENPERAPGEVFVSFEPPKGKPAGTPPGSIALAVGEGARWRTWAFTRQAHESGEWQAVVRDQKGRELARQPFEVRL
jgi:hypothetical protein